MRSGLAFALEDVAQERYEQDEKWGVQHHPDGTGGDGTDLEAKAAIARCEGAFADDNGTWRHILEEEFYEAMAKTDQRELIRELTQVAAVAVAWIEDIRGR